MTKSIILNKTVSDIVDSYNHASQMVARAYQELEEAKRIFSDSFGEQAYIDVIDRYHIEFGEKGYQHVHREIKKRVWRRLINLLSVRRFLSVQRAEDLDRQLENNEMPEITLIAIYETVESLRQNSANFAQEAAKEVFELLRPASTDNYAPLKTNEKHGRYALGKKVILVRYIENTYGGGFRGSHYHTGEIRAIDRVFHMLDGKAMTEGYQSPLMDAINTCAGAGETEYFRFKCHQNGNLHLEFKRPELVKELNRLAGDGTLLQG